MSQLPVHDRTIDLEATGFLGNDLHFPPFPYEDLMSDLHKGMEVGTSFKIFGGAAGGGSHQSLIAQELIGFLDCVATKDKHRGITITSVYIDEASSFGVRPIGTVLEDPLLTTGQQQRILRELSNNELCFPDINVEKVIESRNLFIGQDQSMLQRTLESLDEAMLFDDPFTNEYMFTVRALDQYEAHIVNSGFALYDGPDMNKKSSNKPHTHNCHWQKGRW